MAASASAWGKPGAWALDAEEHEAAVAKDDDVSSESSQQPDFPSLAAAASSKTSKKKKKAQPLSLAEFTTGKPVSHGSAGRLTSSSSKGLTPDELLLLPTGPRQRSSEELERSTSHGFGYGYGARGRAPGEDGDPARWGSSRVSEEPRRGGFGGSGGGSNRDLEPSRADEIDDWGAAKKSFVPEKRERGGGGFFDSQSRADESDSWISSKPPADGRRIGGGAGFGGPRERMGGFEMFNKEGSEGLGAGSETWGRRKDFPDTNARRRDEETSGGGADSGTWERKKDFADSNTWRRDEDRSGGDGRRRLMLQPRSLTLSNGNNGEQVQGEQDKGYTEMKSKGSNPFGQARPREEVLAEKGQDWKKIDEKLETIKIQDAPLERSSFGNKEFGVVNGARRMPENRTDRAWRKPETIEASPLREAKFENAVPEN